MWTTLPEVFPFFKRERSKSYDVLDVAASTSPRRNSAFKKAHYTEPSIHVSTDKPAYRPGDVVVATIDVRNDGAHVRKAETFSDAVLMEELFVEVKGVERVDPQWLVSPKPPSGSKQRRGERVLLESSSTSILSKSSYRTVGHQNLWSYKTFENGHGEHAPPRSMSPLEVRSPIQIWTRPSCSGLTADELHSKDHYGFSGIVPPSVIKVDIQWREKDEFSQWTQAEDFTLVEDDKTSKRSESSSSSPLGENLDRPFKDGILGSPFIVSRTVNGPTASLRKALSHSALPAAYTSDRLDVQEMMSNALEKRLGLWDGGSEGSGSFESVARGYENGNDGGYEGREEERGFSPPSSPSMPYLRGKTYNIKINDQIIVRFTPSNPSSTYFFGDTVSGTLSFLREEGARRCLEVSVVLETREILNPSYLHPSRKNSSVISKVQSEYVETVCDMLNSHFIFSVPLDGPASFSTPLISVQWILRFEFVASPPHVDWSKYDHPLLIEERERGEWSLPLVVHAPLPRRTKKDSPVSPRSKVTPEGDVASFAFSPPIREGSPVKLRGRASSSRSF